MVACKCNGALKSIANLSPVPNRPSLWAALNGPYLLGERENILFVNLDSVRLNLPDVAAPYPCCLNLCQGGVIKRHVDPGFEGFIERPNPISG